MANLDSSAVQLVRDMKAAINAADAQLRKSGLKIEKVELDLNTVIEKTVTGGIEIKLIEIGGSLEKKEANKLSLTLVPDPTAARLFAAPPEDLTAAIAAAAAASQEAASSPPAFKLSEAAISMEVGVTADGKFKLFVGGSGSRAQAHTMVIKLTPS